MNIRTTANALFFAPFSGSQALRAHPNVFTVRASYSDEAAKILQSKRTVGAEKAVILHRVFATAQFSVVADFLKESGTKGNSIPVAPLSFVNPDELAESMGGMARGTIVSQVVSSPRASRVRPPCRPCPHLAGWTWVVFRSAAARPATTAAVGWT